ncbi:glycosyltransferase family 4 protein [Vibrio brasiliensis]|uniref:Glycosyl transferase, group 1 family protein n=1 Tax=Vibrio brasiliensis LMG 20546 TaxID=945543 RepID=E8M060_9VIBR|nr:glycosyltransferase family 4 protein [Vibrio brasiliensis]EGA63712.1 glycosyl transferase, group 1 family protein [Vibrio brasiliensis LMG 20546]
MNKTILIVVNVDWFFVSHRLPIALRAIEQGYTVHLASSFSTHKAKLTQLGIVCHDIPFTRSGSSLVSEGKVLLRLRKLIAALKPDLVHAITIKPVLYTGLSLQSFSRPPAFVAAISGLGYVFSADTKKAKFVKLLVSMFYRLALRGKRKTVIFQNDSDQNILSNIIELPASQRTLIKGSGVDLNLYHHRPESAEEREIVSMACRLLKEKGVYEFVEAAKIIKCKRPKTAFWLIGSIDPENPNSVEQGEIDRWVDSGVIEALGHRTDIPELFARSSVVTMPSFYGEGVPKVLIEAAACGRPVVTTDNPGCRDAIIDNVSGLLVPTKDSQALAEAIMVLLLDKEKRAEMGEQARRYAVREFDVNNVVSRHIEIYKFLIESK